MEFLRSNCWAIIMCMAIMCIVCGCGDGSSSDDGDENGTLSPLDMDDDGDGITENQGDCNDADASINPNATEVCGDGIDQDCSGSDMNCSTEAKTYEIVDTGQDDCYDDNDVLNTWPAAGGFFFGQDAQHTGNSPSFTHNSNDTITETSPV